MASHVRTQIRDALMTLLLGLSSTGDRVFPSRVSALNEDELPALRLYVDGESINASAISSPTSLERGISIRIQCCAALIDGLDELLDQMALEVEHAIAADTTLSGLLAVALMPTGIQVERDDDGAVPLGTLTLNFDGVYATFNNAVDDPA